MTPYLWALLFSFVGICLIVFFFPEKDKSLLIISSIFLVGDIVLSALKNTFNPNKSK